MPKYRSFKEDNTFKMFDITGSYKTQWNQICDEI